MKKTSKISILPRPSVNSSFTSRQAGDDIKGKKRDLVEEFHVVSSLTGEEVGRYVFDGRVMPKPGDWVRLYQGFAEELSRYPEQTIEARALWLVVAKAGFGNFARINVSEVATAWGVARQSLSNALSAMVRRRIIERAKGGNYRLNPNFIWKGDIQNRLAQCSKWAATSIDQAKPKADDSAASA